MNKSDFVGQEYHLVANQLDEQTISYRVYYIDGKYLRLTMEYNPTRLNFKLENHVITDMYIG